MKLTKRSNCYKWKHRWINVRTDPNYRKSLALNKYSPDALDLCLVGDWYLLENLNNISKLKSHQGQGYKGIRQWPIN